jgi:phosphoglycerate dehydrogenase-like enzyme
MTGRLILVVTPPEDGWQIVQGSRRYLHGGKRYRDLADAILAAHGEIRHLEWVPGGPPEGGDEWLDASLPEADALILAPWLPWPNVDAFPVFDEARLGRAAALEVIAGTFDFRLSWIDLDEAARRGVIVVDTSRTMTTTVAEFGVAITLALLRDIHAAIEVVRNGGWFDSPRGGDTYIFRDLADCRVGLAGYGSINLHYRRFIEPYGCEVIAYDPFVGDDVLVAGSVSRAGSLVELARRSDILVVSIPPTPSTIGIIDASVIEALAPGSLFVLLSRMAVVEQDPLWRRIRSGELRAAIDVFDPEPPPSDAWFRHAPNVLPTPHIAGNVQFAHERCFTEACADAARVLGGEAPHHGVSVRDKGLYDGTLAAVRTEGDHG